MATQAPSSSLLNSLASRTETGKTGITCTNTDFITAIFGDTGAAKPVIVSFAGNPNEVSKSVWFGKTCADDKVLTADRNNYVSFAAFNADSAGQYRRQKKQFAGLYAVMLDDVGTKAPLDRITLPASWMLETSPGNYQIGLILNDPITDPAEADQLVNAIIDAGLSDPGASGPCARLGRLPVAINGKHGFQCRLTEWEPSRRYSAQQIVDGLQIEIKEKSKRTPGKKPEVQHDNDDVHVPRANENPVIKALKFAGLYKQPLGEGKHDVTCPWVREHTDAVDAGTAYFEPSESYPIGGFKCLHGHCADRRVTALHDALGISKIDAKHKASILVQAGELPRICDAAEIELSKTLRHYQRGGFLVTITTDPGTRETAVKPLSLPSLTRALAGLAIWQRYDKRAECWVPIDPPEKYIRVLCDSSSYAHMPVLNGIARQPYLRADGSLMTMPGYDVSTGMFGVFDAKKFNVADKPSRQQAEQALEELAELLTEFPFKTKHDHAAAIAGILTAAVRASLPHAPMFHTEAPGISSGKSYLCELLTAFASPQHATPHAFPADDEEMRKLLLAELLTAPAVIEFDNLTSDLVPHKSLCTVLTSEFISGRILGQSKTVEVGTRALFLSSGNNVGPVRDMTRRVLTINLDPACEIPAARDFHKSPVNEVKADRGRFVSLALTIVRAWICAGRPKTECKTIATYGVWSDYCRQSLLWLGLPDPAACIFELMATDPDRELLGQMLRGWHEKFAGNALLVRDALKVIHNGDEDLLDAIKDIAAERDGSINSRKLGWWLKRHAGRVVDGVRFVQDDSSRGAVKWKTQVMKVLPVSFRDAGHFRSEKNNDRGAI